jgi:long-chain acyl-CoA synthetase
MTSAVRLGSLERSHPEIAARAARAASGLHELGMRAGDRAAIVLRNDPAYVEVTAAIRVLGGVPVPVNWHWRGQELAHLLGDSASRVAFVHADLLDEVERVAGDDVQIIELPVPPDYPAPAAPSGRHVDYEAWLAGQPAWSRPAASAPMSMIYTSGTTGAPKGVRRAPTTSEQDAGIGEMVSLGFGLLPGMRTLIPAPIYHTAPNTHLVMGFALGCDITLMARFDPEGFLALVQRHRIEHTQMVPTMFTRLLALPQEVRDRYDVSSLQRVVHAAAPCPVPAKRDMIEWLGPIVTEYYGGTESGIVVYCDSAEWLAHPGTVGRPMSDGAVRILGPEGQELPVDEEGEVYLRPPSAWPEFTYENDPAKRAAIERDGFVTLGDAGRVDADGFLYLTDRVKDMVIAGGVNIYPVEIEQCLMTLAGVRDVAVFGIPDADRGEALAAHIELDPGAGLTEDDVRDHVRSRLASYKVPRRVVFDDRLPREDTGKLFKRKLREAYWDPGRRI